jgi:hypothetical protein
MKTKNAIITNIDKIKIPKLSISFFQVKNHYES